MHSGDLIGLVNFNSIVHTLRSSKKSGVIVMELNDRQLLGGRGAMSGYSFEGNDAYNSRKSRYLRSTIQDSLVAGISTLI